MRPWFMQVRRLRDTQFGDRDPGDSYLRPLQAFVQHFNKELNGIWSCSAHKGRKFLNFSVYSLYDIGTPLLAHQEQDQYNYPHLMQNGPSEMLAKMRWSAKYNEFASYKLLRLESDTEGLSLIPVTFLIGVIKFNSSKMTFYRIRKISEWKILEWVVL